MSQSPRPVGWKYDLPSPNAHATVEDAHKSVEPSPNHIDDCFLELPRASLKIRGYWLILGPLLMLGVSTITAITIYISIIEPSHGSLELMVSAVLFSALTFWILTPFIRIDIGLPRHEPIRFNRRRRKVYFYQYRFDRLHPLGRKNWGVKAVAYNWDDITAEAYRIYRPLGYGGLKEEVMLSIRKAGTDDVIDRVFFTDDIQKGEQYWTIARLFMQQGPEALPDFIHPPRDWDDYPNPAPWENALHRNPFDRLAPKVQWPADMDLESRTAPSQGEHP
ncbi:DUF6708 domain-containing protein [Pseudomonas sp. NPDC090233]|uniref:DUF6708 domain-containing protein n=1 Tax=Pseudomonas sp. NPDC090233 TaxID=3364479 RepID=UPI00383B0C66